MSERDANEAALLEHLFGVFQTVNDWLRFAEAKNGAILALSGSALGILLGIMSNVPFPSKALLGYVAACAMLLSGSVAAALASFVPRTRLPVRNRRSHAAAPNLLFYGDLASMSPGEFLAETRRALGMSATDAALPMDEHVAAQIIANSRVTLWKFQLALVATHLAGAAVLSPLFLLIHAYREWRARQ